MPARSRSPAEPARPRPSLLGLLALLGASLACTVYDEAGLLSMRGSGSCTLAADITLSGPVKPIDFRGRLDGQGHWIRNIDFDFQAVYEAAGGGTGRAVDLNVNLFTAPSELTNIGLEFRVNFANDIGAINQLNLSAAGFSASGLAARDVVVNGSLSVRNGTYSIDQAYIGGVMSSSSSTHSSLGPNATSYCDVTCEASTVCGVGGLAGFWYGSIRGAAAIGNRFEAQAGFVGIGGLVGYSESSRIEGSFAEGLEITSRASSIGLELGGLTVTLAGSVGGLVGVYLGAGAKTVADCYGSLASLDARAVGGATGEFLASPLIGIALLSESLTITRSYGLARGSFSIDNSEQDACVGGLFGDARADRVSISQSFALLEDVSISANDAELGGLFGYSAPLSEGDLSFSISQSWARLGATSVSAASSLYLGGLFGASMFGRPISRISDVSASLELTPDAVDAPSASHVCAFAGEANADISGVFLEYRCRWGQCPPLYFLNNTNLETSNIYIFVVLGESDVLWRKDGFETATGKYDQASYPGLSGSAWDFHAAERAYPTLSALPVRDWTEAREFAEPARSAWSGWMVPESAHNHPQLADNRACKLVAGDILCVSCPDGYCLECEGNAHSSGWGEACREGGGLSVSIWVIVGAAAGGVVVIGLVVGLSVFFCLRRKKRTRSVA